MAIKKFGAVSTVTSSAVINLDGGGFLPSKHFGIFAVPSADFAGAYAIEESSDGGSTWATAKDSDGNDISGSDASTLIFDVEGLTGDRVRLTVSAVSAGSVDAAMIS